MAEHKRLSFSETLKDFGMVAATTYKVSPLAAITKIIGTIIGSIIPLLTTFAVVLSWRRRLSSRAVSVSWCGSAVNSTKCLLAKLNKCLQFTDVCVIICLCWYAMGPPCCEKTNIIPTPCPGWARNSTNRH